MRRATPVSAITSISVPDTSASNANDTAPALGSASAIAVFGTPPPLTWPPGRPRGVPVPPATDCCGGDVCAGDAVGLPVGEPVGEVVGLPVGDPVAVPPGDPVGLAVADALSLADALAEAL